MIKEKVQKRLQSARRQFKALPNAEEYDYFCVSVYFVQEQANQIHLVMDAVAVKNSKQLKECEDSDFTFLGKREVLCELFENQNEIFDFISHSAKYYQDQMVIFLPKHLISYHGLDGQTILTAENLTRIIHSSIATNDFHLWNDEVGFRIDLRNF